jgi:ATP-binding cassette subfamily F protein 3
MQKEQFLNDQRQVVASSKGIERQAGVTQTMLSHRKMSSYHAREKVVASFPTVLRKRRHVWRGGP